MTTSPSSPTAPVAALSPRQWGQIAVLTVAALVLYLFLRWLPTGTNLYHGDFSVSGEPGSTLEFCDPANPQFLPVVTVRSPVETRVRTDRPARAGEAVQVSLRLRTATGKPIGPRDLLESHTRPLHVMAVDPSLTDYQHLHPEPGEQPGEWVFTLTPRSAGLYRIFCDFTPAATGRGLYASAELEVAGAAAVGVPPAVNGPATWAVTHAGYEFTLQPSRPEIRVREPVDFALTVTRADGGVVELGEVMGAYAHLVAFDRERTGFAHLHPLDAPDTDLARGAPRLNFQVMIPQAGRYVVWAQVQLGGEDVFVPFWFDVV